MEHLFTSKNASSCPLSPLRCLQCCFSGLITWEHRGDVIVWRFFWLRPTDRSCPRCWRINAHVICAVPLQQPWFLRYAAFFYLIRYNDAETSTVFKLYKRLFHPSERHNPVKTVDLFGSIVSRLITEGSDTLHNPQLQMIPARSAAQ